MKATEKIDKSRLFKRAWYLLKRGEYSTFSKALIQVWAEMKKSLNDNIDYLKEVQRQIISGVELQYTGSYSNQSAETMAEYYSSNKYKGD